MRPCVPPRQRPFPYAWRSLLPVLQMSPELYHLDYFAVISCFAVAPTHTRTKVMAGGDDLFPIQFSPMPKWQKLMIFSKKCHLFFPSSPSPACVISERFCCLVFYPYHSAAMISLFTRCFLHSDTWRKNTEYLSIVCLSATSKRQLRNDIIM